MGSNEDMIRGPPPKGFHPCPYGDQLWNSEPYCSWGVLPNDKECTFDLCHQIWETNNEGQRLLIEYFSALVRKDEEEEKRLKRLLNLNGVLAEELKIRLYRAHTEDVDDFDRMRLTYEFNQTRLEGRVFYKTNEKGDRNKIISNEPSWEGFKDAFLDAHMPVGKLLRKLREGYQMSISDAAESIGISEEELKRVEENGNISIFWREKNLVKNIFMGIINASERWKVK